MKTRHLAGMIGTATSFDRLIGSELGQRYLTRARAEQAVREQKAEHAAAVRSTPHVEVARRKLAAELHARLVLDPTPVISKFDAAQLAVAYARQTPRDYGLRRAALTIHRRWQDDRDGSFSIADLARLRAHATREWPKGGTPRLFDEVLPRAGYHHLPVRQLRGLAATISTQRDYDEVVRVNGLGGPDPFSRRARAFIRAQVMGEPMEMGVEAVTPPNISEETMHELKQKEEAGEIDNAYAVAWEISKKKESAARRAMTFNEADAIAELLAARMRAAGDDGNAGEQAFHPDVPEEGQSLDDAVDADKVMKGKARRADRPAEPEFKPPIEQQHEATDQEGVTVPDSDMTKLSRDQRRATIKAMLRGADMRYWAPEQIQEAKAAIFDRFAQQDESADEELAEDIEETVTEHMRENAPAELAEGHEPWAKAKASISRARIESAMLDGRTVRVGRYQLRIATRKNIDQVEMTAAGEPPMAWPLRRMTAAIDYFAKVVEGQALEAPEVNRQQPDAVKPPSKKTPLGEESSGQDVESLEPDSILDSHPAQDQAGTSEPASNMGEGVNDEEGFSDPSVSAQHPAGDQAGTSEPDPDLGPHSSDQEPAAFDVGKVSPGRSARVDRKALREAMRGTIRHVRPNDDENA